MDKQTEEKVEQVRAKAQQVMSIIKDLEAEYNKAATGKNWELYDALGVALATIRKS